jgi:hypothetical protein
LDRLRALQLAQKRANGVGFAIRSDPRRELLVRTPVGIDASEGIGNITG